jgi:hypothetical protein
MTEPIKLPPLTVRMLMDVFRSHARIPPALLSASWKDGIDIDAPSPKAQRLVESFATLAVEQATADLRAMLDRAIERLHAAEAALQPVKAERDEARAELARLTELLSDVRAVEAELAEKSDELARLTTLRPVSEWKEEDVVFWELYGPAEYARWRHSDAFHASHWTPLPDVKEIK